MPAISKSPWRMSWFSFCLAGVTGDARCDGSYGWIIKQRPIFEEKDVAIYCKTERICRWETLMYQIFPLIYSKSPISKLLLEQN